MPAPIATATPARPRARRIPDWKALPAPDPALEIVVIVPVKDEARRLPATLRSLAGQRGLDGKPLDPARFEIIVLANNCSDASAEVVRRIAARRPALRLHVAEARFPADVAHVGHARACLMNEACRRLRWHGCDDGVIASTDGDTRVAADWLAATLAEVRAGADAVGGRIVMDGDAARVAGLERFTRQDELYQQLRVRLEHAIDPDPADPWPRHHQHFGASLAITTRAYRHVGGLPAEPFLEDEALYQALRRHDIKVRHSEKVAVVTSSRRQGRVEVGLSWQLREWASLAKAHRTATVADPVAWAEELRQRRQLRGIWSSRRDSRGRLLPTQRERAERLARQWGLSPRWLAAQLSSNMPFGSLYSAVQERRRERGLAPPALVTMASAIRSLRALLAAHRRQARARADRAGSARAASHATA